MKIGAIPLTIVTFYTLVAFQLDGLAVDRKEAAFDGRSMPVDSLVQAATKQFDAGDAQEATRVFQEVVRIDPGNAKAHLMLGAIWLGQRRFEEAEEAFNQACHTDDSADSWYGLGMVAAGGDQSRKKEALKRFREALRRDPHLFDARYQLALTLRGLGEGNAEAEMEQLARLDPHYGLAYLQISRWAEQKPHGSEVAMEWCQRGLKVLPEDRGLQARLAELQLQSPEDQDRAIVVLMDRFRSHPEEIHLLPGIAQAHLKKDRYTAADAVFREYLDRAEPQVRAYYEDISLVGTPEEVKAFRALDPAQVPEFLVQFWTRRDVDLTPGVNKRRLEHYRRVWVARTQFSEGQKPWDRRGEVYIRYGEPYFRQRSGEADSRTGMDRKVLAVRRRLATRLYGTELDFDLEGILRVLKGSHRLSMDLAEHVPLDLSYSLGPVYPVAAPGGGYTIVASGRSAGVGWESWVYPHVSGGIEITFTDELQNGNYDLGPPPAVRMPSDPRNRFWVHFNTLMARDSPERILGNLKADAPSLYLSEIVKEPLTCYVAAVDFRGHGDSTRIELCLSVPAEQIDTTVPDWEGERRLVVYDKFWREVHQWTDRSALRIRQDSGHDILDREVFELPPGDYHLALNVRDPASKRSMLYRDSLHVTELRGGSLQVSGIQLARNIAPADGDGRFVKNGLEVIPMPSLRFRSHEDVFLYFEVYNLKQDSNGRTCYQVDYTVRKQEGGVGRLIFSGLGRLIGKTTMGNEVTVSYELGGESAQEVIHTALDLRHGKKGDYTLEVTVKDLNSGMVQTRAAGFNRQ